MRFYDVYSSAAAIEAMRSGRMHLGTMSSGDTAFAVNVAGAIPIGIRGDAAGPQGYQLWMIVKADSPYQKPPDLDGKVLRAWSHFLTAYAAVGQAATRP